jgi:hypothetical protein
MKVNGSSGETYCLSLQSGRVNQARNQYEADSTNWLTFYPEDGGDIFFRNVYWNSSEYTYPIRQNLAWSPMWELKIEHNLTLLFPNLWTMTENQQNCVKTSEKIIKSEPEYDGKVERSFPPFSGNSDLTKNMYCHVCVTFDRVLN